MTNKELAESIRNNMFASRKTVDEAFEYVNTIAKASENPIAVWTAVMVLTNTISNEILENEKEVA